MDNNEVLYDRDPGTIIKLFHDDNYARMLEKITSKLEIDYIVYVVEVDDIYSHLMKNLLSLTNLLLFDIFHGNYCIERMIESSVDGSDEEFDA